MKTEKGFRVQGSGFSDAQAEAARPNAQRLTPNASVRPHLSPSQLETFCQCPERWRRIYLEGERIPPATAMLRGTAVHAAAAHNFAQKVESHADLPPADLAAVADASFTAELESGGVELTADEESVGKEKVLGQSRDAAVKMAEFHAREQAPDYQPVLVEAPFRVELPGTHDLVGVIDLADDRARVTDLKTATKRKTQADADDSLQLTVYDVGHRVLTGQPAAELRLDTIVQGKRDLSRHVLSTERTPADFAALAQRVNIVTASIAAGVFTPAPLGAWWCSQKWCGFHRTCPYVNSERKAAAEE
jgi:hypothetical protein